MEQRLRTQAGTLAVSHLCTAMALMALAAGAQADVAMPLNNGSFEGGFTSDNAADGTGISVTPTGWSLITAGGESRSSWSETRATPASPASPDGGAWWSLEYVTGWTTYGTNAARYNAGGIQQTVGGLIVGHAYAVSFYSMANAPDPSSENSLGEYWSVSLGNGSAQNGATVYSNQHTVWQQSTLNFVATQTSEVLKFSGNWLGATPGATPTYLNLDGIQVVDKSATPVPEPTAAWLLVPGLILLAISKRRQRDA